MLMKTDDQHIKNVYEAMDKESLNQSYGFVDFDSPAAAQKAVSALKASGVQAQMAKVFLFGRLLNSLLQASSLLFDPRQQEQDPTNLYISNLPLSMDEQELENMLKPFGQVISTRILRDSSGTSRGVGFARMESTEKCEAVIGHFNGKFIKTPPGVSVCIPDQQGFIDPLAHFAHDIGAKAENSSGALTLWTNASPPTATSTTSQRQRLTDLHISLTKYVQQNGSELKQHYELYLSRAVLLKGIVVVTAKVLEQAWVAGGKGSLADPELKIIPTEEKETIFQYLPCKKTIGVQLKGPLYRTSYNHIGSPNSSTWNLYIKVRHPPAATAPSRHTHASANMLTQEIKGSLTPTEPLLCKFADGGQKKRQNPNKYIPNGRPWHREGEAGMTLTYDPTTAALQNGFYPSPYSIATNRMITQTSITPYIASPVSAYQIFNMIKKSSKEIGCRANSLNGAHHVTTARIDDQPSGPADESSVARQHWNSSLGALNHDLSIEIFQQSPEDSLGNEAELAPDQLPGLVLSILLYMPATSAMQGAYLPQYAHMQTTAVPVEEASGQQQVAVETSNDHSPYTFQPNK
ncbi:hypothetical protein P7K49_014069 [Saguinus oedipus]|uniref:RRM domain-containing protein n=1 Tax=Saguinus oedipus TaxID=9490 RepID=A0ABQ9VHU7_SAGOE|nr:hypothetical protein P7K49_014069 [Saguinus oedipus]